MSEPGAVATGSRLGDGFASKVEARPLRLGRPMCGSAPRFRQPYSILGLRPKSGRSPESSNHLSEGQRPSAHPAAEPLLANDF
jgi:hypothetical protein